MYIITCLAVQKQQPFLQYIISYVKPISSVISLLDPVW